jgi:uncharacterized protein (UPF0332 family)
MTREEEGLAYHRIAIAKESLTEAVTLLDNGLLRGATNRLYYAAFYAAKALLATRGLDSTRHSGVIALFNRNFVKTGVIKAEVARTLMTSFELRQDLDYEDFFAIEAESAQLMKDEVTTFIGECERILNGL